MKLRRYKNGWNKVPKYDTVRTRQDPVASRFAKKMYKSGDSWLDDQSMLTDEELRDEIDVRLNDENYLN